MNGKAISIISIAHRSSNASHCICNDELKLAPNNMIFRAFEVIRNEKSVPYLTDYPRGSVYTIFEERTVYISSDSNKLFRELEFARGVSKEEYDKEGMQFRCLISHLAIAYDEEHNIINVLKNFSKNLFLKVSKDNFPILNNCFAKRELRNYAILFPHNICAARRDLSHKLRNSPKYFFWS